MPTADGKGRVYVYVRASTASQDDSPAIQTEIAQKYTASKSLGTVDAVFSDPATSGSTPMAERKSGQKMLEVLRAGDIVIVVRMDRAFRNLADAASVIDRFVRLNAQLHIIDSPLGTINMLDPFAKYMFQNFAALAELERELTTKRIIEGKRYARSMGRLDGNAIPIGYMTKTHPTEKTRNGSVRRYLVPNPHERNILYECWMLRRKGWPWYSIWAHMNNKGVTTRAGKPIYSANKVKNYVAAFESILAAEPHYAKEVYEAERQAKMELYVPKYNRRKKQHKEEDAAYDSVTGSLAGGEDQDRTDLDQVEDDAD